MIKTLLTSFVFQILTVFLPDFYFLLWGFPQYSKLRHHLKLNLMQRQTLTRWFLFWYFPWLEYWILREWVGRQIIRGWSFGAPLFNNHHLFSRHSVENSMFILSGNCSVNQFLIIINFIFFQTLVNCAQIVGRQMNFFLKHIGPVKGINFLIPFRSIIWVVINFLVFNLDAYVGLFV